MKPYYLLEESLLRRNLSLIKSISDRAGVEFILAFKAFALWKTFPIFREYISHTTASSPLEARMAFEKFGTKAHTYSPAYEKDTFGDILDFSSHITFNSLSQFETYKSQIISRGVASPSIGLRINPEYSEIETDLYNPCAPGSRFGIMASQLPKHLPANIEGFHCHCHCESSALALEHTLQHIDEKFSKWLPTLSWLNLGGGHLVTKKGYQVEYLIDILTAFKAKYPNLKLILEPGSAFAWQTGSLYSEIIDIVDNNGIKTAILNVSFTCHMPDCLEMPYFPEVRGAETLGNTIPTEVQTERTVYRLGGNSCLSGDYMGYWRFDDELSVGDIIIFEDMLHYTTVKTNMFNGIMHPSIKIRHMSGDVETLREYTYEDYLCRMD